MSKFIASMLLVLPIMCFAEEHQAINSNSKSILNFLKNSKFSVRFSQKMEELEKSGKQIKNDSFYKSFQFIKIPGLKDKNGKTIEFQLTETTQFQYEVIMGINPSHYRGYDDSYNRPVEGINYYFIQDYIGELTKLDGRYEYRLPTEEEWRFAAGEIPDNKELKEYAWVWENSKGVTHSVATRKPNKFGLYDMLGNLNEWTITKNLQDSSNFNLPGGSYGTETVNYRATEMGISPPHGSHIDVGFRLVRTPK